MELRPEEITKIIRNQIKFYENKIETAETGTVIRHQIEDTCADESNSQHDFFHFSFSFLLSFIKRDRPFFYNQNSAAIPHGS